MKKYKSIVIFIFCLLLGIPANTYAQTLTDIDRDGLTNIEETTLYYTDPHNPDTDGDGFMDGEEIIYHYSPHKKGARLSGNDFDGDGLSDWLELQFGSNISVKDTDGDGHDDYDEVVHSFDPTDPTPVKMKQVIVVDTKNQRVQAFANDVQLTDFVASTGKPGYDTPKGIFSIQSKHPRAWSRSYGLWMPYWMAFIGSSYGLHELPEWPGGYKEGQDHLGVPVSHGCVRLGVGDAEWLYTWASVGTTVEVR